MSPDDIHKILIPYLYAAGLLVLTLAVAAWILRLHGKRQDASPAGEGRTQGGEARLRDEQP